MKNLLLLSTLFASLFFIINCSPNRSSNGNVGAIATTNGACPAGYWYSNGQCYNGSGQLPSQFGYNNGFYADNYSGYSSLQITNPTLMKQFFKLGMGVCDLASNNYGVANCDYYVTGQTDLIIQFPNNVASGSTVPAEALVTVFARPRQNQHYNYQASFGSWWQVAGSFFGIYIPDNKYYSGAYRNPLQVPMGVSAANNNQGFQASGYGDAWTGYSRTLLTVEVLNGNISTSQTLDFKLKIGGQEAAIGRMSRCQTANCGI
jgi:hypothetical protein